MGIQSYMGHAYEGEVFGVRVAATRRHHLYVMAVPSGARAVRVMCVCMAAPSLWAVWVCVGDVFECALWWLTPLGRASTKRFLILMMPKRRD